MMNIYPNKLKTGDEIRVIAPSRSLAGITSENIDLATAKLTSLGLKVTFGKCVHEIDLFDSSSIKSRIYDLHEAFGDKNVKAILAARGGSNANQLLQYIDYDLIKHNPKIFCGYSDITALQNAIYKMTNLVTYSGPQFSSFAMQQGFDYTLDYFKRALFDHKPIDILASTSWSDDNWLQKQQGLAFHANEGFWPIHNGNAQGVIIGGNIGTLQLLNGTKYLPSLQKTILFLEADAMAGDHCVPEFDRVLQSLIYQPHFEAVQAIVFGRFEERFGMSLEKLQFIIKNKPELDNLPIVANVDFGHTMPMITFPIGGTCEVNISDSSQQINLVKI